MKKVLFCSIAIAIFSSFQVKPADNAKLLLTAIINSRSENNLFIKVTLTNNSPDSVKYVTWNCSWQERYAIDNDRWKISVNLCFKNGPETITIPPFQSETKILELKRITGLCKSRNPEFKIGFHFVPPPVTIKELPLKVKKIKSKDVMIWSNTLTTNYSSQN
ncbi:hypothetical protein [Ferruginibacter profundus]